MQSNPYRKQIYYIGFYSDVNNNHKSLYSTPASTNKMKYIAKSLVRVGHRVQILSPTWSLGKGFAFYSARTVLNKDNVSVKYSPTFSAPFKVIKIISSYFSLFWLFVLLLLKTNKETYVLLYHSTFFYYPILIAKKICRFKLILEVEEIYHLFTKSKKRREDAVLSMADGYLFANKGIKNYLTKEKDRKKLFVIVNGEYEIIKAPKTKKKDNEYINVVFAGNIESVRRGAFNAVSCAKYLSDKYRVYLIGFGKKSEISSLNKKIKLINDLFKYKKCEYLGIKHGVDYNQFLFDCDIAINPQEPNESYMQFAFPSKILSYLGHNLRVVTTRLEAIAESELADLVTMVPNPTPKKFAEAIMNVDLHGFFNAADKIEKADSRFVDELKLLII